MATNKHAIIRYHALDRCFSNPGRRYFIDELIIACNEALYEYTGTSEGVKRRQIFEDIKFMESEQGWSVPLERLKDGKQVYYRYSDKSFSIKNQVFNESEAKQLSEALSILSRFKGMPQFEWMEELQIRIESIFTAKTNTSIIADFEQNQYLKGLKYFTEIFHSIQYNKVIIVEYKGFKQINQSQVILHPYYLKQYNSRWFLFGYNEKLNKISNLALDRIVSIRETKKKYFANTSIDFNDYFDDVIGVTVSEDAPVTKVQIEIEPFLWPYIESKPMHGSQRLITKKNEKVVIELAVQINYELIASIFAYGEGVKVLQPNELKEEIKNRAQALLHKYL